MSKSSPVQPGFQVKDITIKNIRLIEIKNVSDNRSYGRRFTVSYGNKASDEVTFNAIFKRVEKIAKKETNIKNLKKIETALVYFEQTEKEAADAYDSKEDTLYKILTWISRIFQFGSHSDRIDKLRTRISDKLEELDLASFIPRLQAKYPAESIDQIYERATKVYIDTGNYALAVKTTGEIKNSPAIKEALLHEIGETCITNNDLKNALAAAKAMSDSDIVSNLAQSKKMLLLQKVADAHVHLGEVGKQEEIEALKDALYFTTAESCFETFKTDGDLRKAFDAANAMSDSEIVSDPAQSKKMQLLRKIADGFIKLAPFEEVEGVTVIIENGFSFKTAHLYIKNGDLDNAFKTAKEISDSEHVPELGSIQPQKIQLLQKIADEYLKLQQIDQSKLVKEYIAELEKH